MKEQSECVLTASKQVAKAYHNMCTSKCTHKYHSHQQASSSPYCKPYESPLEQAWECA